MLFKPASFIHVNHPSYSVSVAYAWLQFEDPQNVASKNPQGAEEISLAGNIANTEVIDKRHGNN